LSRTNQSALEAGALADSRGWQTRNMIMATTTVYGSPQPRVRVLVADDHEVMRLGIRNLLELRPGWSVCAEASNGKEAVEKTLQFRPDVIIMDITMPVMNGLDAASQITKREPKIPVILFSLHLSDDLYRHLKTDGIRGAVAKGDAARDLVLAVETVLAGGTFFPGQRSGPN
jgi:DNA-binding NarL/FixJ family response regulator